jgi:hypothetical protein
VVTIFRCLKIAPLGAFWGFLFSTIHIKPKPDKCCVILGGASLNNHSAMTSFTPPTMTRAEIKEQVDTIKRVTERLLESKEQAFRFLKEAGILKEPDTSEKTQKVQNSK